MVSARVADVGDSDEVYLGGWLPMGEKVVMPSRFQPPGLPSRSNHKWDLENVCVHCGRQKVEGEARVKEWRVRRVISDIHKAVPKVPIKLTWDAVRVRRAVHAMDRPKLA